jgi:putative acetyltransferase
MYTIATEAPSEFAEIYELVREAFLTAQHADGDEHDYVNKLRESNNYLPQLAFTVKSDKAIIAHIMLTRMYITTKLGKNEALLLSPICVQLDYRNKGIGGMLIRHSLEAAKKEGYNAVFLVGNPEYYGRFGFVPTINCNITAIGDLPAKYTMVTELTPGFLTALGAGTVSIV